MNHCHKIKSAHAWFHRTIKDKVPNERLGWIELLSRVQAIRNHIGFHLRQAKYITDLLNSKKMIGAKPLHSSNPSRLKLSSTDGTILLGPTVYLRVVGALQYSTISRLDTAYSINQLCQFMHSPCDTR